MMYNRKKVEMFFKRYLFLNFFLACGITFHSSYGSDLMNRKQIYDKYVSVNKFEGKWIDPHSLGIFDGNLEFEEELEDSYTVYSDEVMSNKEETRKSSESFFGHRTLLKNKLQDNLGIGGIFETESNTVFALGRNVMTVSAILSFIVFILFLFFPKTLIFSFVLILSMLWHWMKLYQEKIAEKQNLTENLRHPNECRRGDLRWYEVIYLYLSSYASSQTDCKEYYKAQLVDPFWEVSLPVALMNAFTSTICEPMKVFATTVRFCFAVIFSGLTLLELSIILFSIFIFLLMQYGYSFSFCWGAIGLYRPRSSSADQTVSQSLSRWGLITKYLKSLFFRESAFIHPSKLSIPPDSKKVEFCNKNDKIKVSEKPDEFQKQEKSTGNIRQNAILQSGSLNSEKNYTMVALKISRFRKCHKKSFSC